MKEKIDKKNDINSNSEIDIEFDKLLIALEYCLRKLYIEDNDLINYQGKEMKKDDKAYVSERSIAFRFGHYLQNYFDTNMKSLDLKVDLEYNRYHEETKRNSNHEIVVPDLIVHKRHTDKNYLVMEFKTYWNKDKGKNNHESDKKKIDGFVFNTKYNYRYGIALVLEETIQQTLVGIENEDNWFIH